MRVMRPWDVICRFFRIYLLKYFWSAETCSFSAFSKIAKSLKSMHPTVRGCDLPPCVTVSCPHVAVSFLHVVVSCPGVAVRWPHVAVSCLCVAVSCPPVNCVWCFEMTVCGCELPASVAVSAHVWLWVAHVWLSWACDCELTDRLTCLCLL